MLCISKTSNLGQGKHVDRTPSRDMTSVTRVPPNVYFIMMYNMSRIIEHPMVSHTR